MPEPFDTVLEAVRAFRHATWPGDYPPQVAYPAASLAIDTPRSHRAQEEAVTTALIDGTARSLSAQADAPAFLPYRAQCAGSLLLGRPRLGGAPTFKVVVRGPRTVREDRRYHWEAQDLDAPTEAVAAIQEHLDACLEYHG